MKPESPLTARRRRPTMPRRADDRPTLEVVVVEEPDTEGRWDRALSILLDAAGADEG